MDFNLKEVLTLFHEGQINKAKDTCLKILKKEPNNIDILNLLGAIAFQNKNYSEAVYTFNKIIQINSNNFQAYYNQGNAYLGLKKFEEALKNYNQAIKIKPDYKQAYNNRGIVLKELKRIKEALENYNQAITIEPNNADLYNNRGTVYLELKQFDKAIEDYNFALTINKNYPEVYFNLGNAFNEFGKSEEAIKSYSQAIKINKNYSEAFFNLGNVLKNLKKIKEAIICYKKVNEINPDFDFLLGTLIHMKSISCDWEFFNQDLKELNTKINKNQKSTPPFPTLSLYESIKIQKKVAEIWIREKFLNINKLEPIKKIKKNKKIKIGYFSADYKNHPVSFQLINLLDLHDRSKFEIYGFSFGLEKEDEMKKRISKVFDKFYDVKFKTDFDIAKLSRDLNIDIAVDLTGFTSNSRFGIFVERCAPIQVNFLGYPGTLGSNHHDYIIADKILIPKENQKDYSEKIIYLPNSFLVNDSTKKISKKSFTREEFGLPKNSFVFCCFNKYYKITPSIFDIWMRLLKKVEGSVLWLTEDNFEGAKNLQKEANQRGVDSNRLIFAKHMPSLADHLVRHKAADLFIDTLPYNAHTTASDALWAGLPVLTRTGESFSSRVAASLLSSIGLPELITKTEKEYETLAIELATNPKRLKQIKKKLEKNKLIKPLFNIKLYTQHIEYAYKKIYKRYNSNTPNENIEIK